MPERPSPALLGALKASEWAETIRAQRAEVGARLAKQVEENRRVIAALPDDLPAEHPLAALFGVERGQDMVDLLKGRPIGHAREVAKRHARVLELSLAKMPLRKIAEETGYSYGHAWHIRSQLRAKGLLRS